MAPTSPQPRRSPRRKNHNSSLVALQPRPAPRRARVERKEQRDLSDTPSGHGPAVDVDMASAAAPFEPLDARLKDSDAEGAAPDQADWVFQASPVRRQETHVCPPPREDLIPPEAQPQQQQQQQPLIADAPTSEVHLNPQRIEGTGLSSPPLADAPVSETQTAHLNHQRTEGTGLSPPLADAPVSEAHTPCANPQGIEAIGLSSPPPPATLRKPARSLMADAPATESQTGRSVPARSEDLARFHVDLTMHPRHVCASIPTTQTQAIDDSRANCQCQAQSPATYNFFFAPVHLGQLDVFK